MTAPPNLLPGLAALAVALVACGPGGSGGPGAASTCPVTTVPASPTFAGDVLPVLQSTCGSASVSCHGPPSGGELPKGKVNFSTASGRTVAEVFADLVDVSPQNAPPGAGWLLVKPWEPGQSWLVVKITQDDPGGAGQAYGNRMPLNEPNLCQATIDTVVTWISQGAAP